MKPTMIACLAAGLMAASFGAAAQTAPEHVRSWAAGCANCHGTNGNAIGDMKPLAGMSAEMLLALLADYRSGAQPATIMHQITKGYSDDQLKLIAGYFAAQTPRP